MITAKESGHWYHKNGSPAYTIIGANKKERKTTLRDAKKLNLFPSVTTVLNILARPGLEIWKRNQLLLSALTLPQVKGESLESFGTRIAEDSVQQAKDAADKGKDKHAIIENYYQTKSCDKKEDIPLCVKIYNVLEEFFDLTFDNVSVEKSFSSPLGYGGKVDISSKKKEIVGDFKTTEFELVDGVPHKKGKKVKLHWPEQAYQLAAYSHGLDMPNATLFNLYISTTTDDIYLHVWPQDEEKDGWKVFESALDIWQITKKYRPEV